MEHPLENNEKIRKNAISAYLMIFASALFLTNRTNPMLNNPFVKSHTKTAFSLHFLILIVVIIFLWFGLFRSIYIFDIGLNNIIASSLLIGLFGVLLYGIYKAEKGEYFTVGEIIHLAKTEKIIDINNDHTLDEKDKLTIILGYVPFLGYIVYGMYHENETIQNITKCNLISSVVISLVYIVGHTNLALLFSLLYIIFIVFTSIILIGKNEIFSLNLEKVPSIGEIKNYATALIKYLQGFYGKDFHPLNDTFKIVLANNEKILAAKKEKIAPLKAYDWKKAMIYIPFVNFANIFKLDTKMYYHIVNGVAISLLFILSWIILGVSNSVQFLLIFPIFFGIGFLYTQETYTLPFIYEFGGAIIYVGEKIISHISFAKKMKAHKQEVSLKPEEKK